MLSIVQPALNTEELAAGTFQLAQLHTIVNQKVNLKNITTFELKGWTSVQEIISGLIASFINGIRGVSNHLPGHPHFISVLQYPKRPRRAMPYHAM